ncbi:hypothetical protein EF847_07595 [Actinobacteria bacterium YIM 96077]|uniref:Uncharacterized protein n=1 Tax=Phytoactinopolyspora halophila TaxID=1981511 RepID=A0A329QPE5_9ACTN|nr:hypothetical protein [Phytoactinopolyspora halophila]AYY12589.1 hypothetical protein EF847_07595 [Actinobacteria bacterium YIM 96077]RAW12508.1 hypothetical protein DPM12_13995 [Phytoactinopolyspora halophila]
MYAISTAAEILGVTPSALEAALERGETIATLTEACGLDLDHMTESLVNAEVPDIEALAMIAGFDSDEIAQFGAEVRQYVTSFIHDGEQAANRRFDGPVLAAA